MCDLINRYFYHAWNSIWMHEVICFWKKKMNYKHKLLIQHMLL